MFTVKNFIKLTDNKKIVLPLAILILIGLILSSFYLFDIFTNKKLFIIDYPVTWGYTVSDTPRAIDTIIIHTSCDVFHQDPFNMPGVIAEYRMYDVAPHYLIARDGTIYRLVDENNYACHAGNSRMPDGRINVGQYSIGIEIINTPMTAPTRAEYRALNKLIRDIKTRHKIRYILGHYHISFLLTGKTDPWNFDWSQIKACSL